MHNQRAEVHGNLIFPKLNNILSKTHLLLTPDREHSKVFEKVPIIGFKKAKSLKDLLVRAKVSLLKTEEGFCSCYNKPRCEICKHITKTHQFESSYTKCINSIRPQNMNCTSKNVVNLFSCKTCHKLNTGSTEEFRSRFNNYPSWHEVFLRDFNQISIERDISEISQKHIKMENFFVKSLRRLKFISKRSTKYISKRCLFCDVFKTSQKHLKIDAFCVTSLRCLEHISERCLFRVISEMSQKRLSQMFVIFQKHPTKMLSSDFRRLTEIFDKIDAGLLETLNKWKVFWEQCITINHVCHEYQWADATWEFWQVNDHQSLKVSVLFTTFSDFFDWLYITRCHCLKYKILGEV